MANSVSIEIKCKVEAFETCKAPRDHIENVNPMIALSSM